MTPSAFHDAPRNARSVMQRSQIETGGDPCTSIFFSDSPIWNPMYRLSGDQNTLPPNEPMYAPSVPGKSRQTDSLKRRIFSDVSSATSHWPSGEILMAAIPFG